MLQLDVKFRGANNPPDTEQNEPENWGRSYGFRGWDENKNTMYIYIYSCK